MLIIDAGVIKGATFGRRSRMAELVRAPHRAPAVAHRELSPEPMGVELAAALRRKDLLIAFAGQLQRARPWSRERPPVFAR